MARGHRGRWIASISALGLLLLLAACGQTTPPATNGAHAGVRATTTPTTISGTPTPTAIPLPYSFPKQWLPAPDGSDLPAGIGSVAFAPSSPQTGYACGITPSNADNAPTTPPYVVATSDGGQSWRTVAGSAAHAKTGCMLFVDQNNARDVFAVAGKFYLGLPQLYRSQDGGATWKVIPQPTVAGISTSVAAIAVVHSRLFAMIGVNGEGNLEQPFYASDNGGQSWQPIDVNMNGQAVQLSEQLWTDGSALIIEAGPPCTGGCGYALPTGAEQIGPRPLSQPLSSQPPTPNYYFKSTDGGRSWTTFVTPVSNLNNLIFALASDGSKTYVVGTALAVPNQPDATIVAFYSSDGGAHWRQLPTLAGVENGFLDAGSLAQGGLQLLPDGSVATMTFHSVGTAEPNQGYYAGMFLLRPSDAAPSWQPLILEDTGTFWQATPMATGLRVWQVRFPPAPPDATTFPGGQLLYFDLP